MSKSVLPDKSTHFADWYQQVIYKADLIDHSPSRGSMVIKPYGFALWERIVAYLDEQIKRELKTPNCYFPLLIPEEFITREKKHVEGFSPELAVVTHAGGKELEERLVIRPTSETIVYHMFSKWIKSWRDLPYKINQWANVVRWEMRSRPFLRTTEFLWQEGHTAHSSKEEALEMVKAALGVYISCLESVAAVPVFSGQKPDSEKFAGAESTSTVEGIMPDGKALQMCTSHLLSPSFPASFDVSYQDEDGKQKTPWCTSWGMTTRVIGAIVMTHGDNRGLVIPPRLAPIQVVILPIIKSSDNKDEIIRISTGILDVLLHAGIRAQLDERDALTPGEKFFEWETKGVPLRIELGAREIEKQEVVLVMRHIQDRFEAKSSVPLAGIESQVKQSLLKIHTDMHAKASKVKESKTHDVSTFENIASLMQADKGMIRTGWCGQVSCEKQLSDISVTIRCCLTSKSQELSSCFYCKGVSAGDIYVAQAY